GRRELHGASQEVLGQARPEPIPQVPGRLAPDLAVRVHLGATDDLAEVPVGVATGAGTRRAGARTGRRPDRAVEWLGADQVVAPTDVRADPDLAVGPGVAEQVLVDQEVRGVPVGPRLA